MAGLFGDMPSNGAPATGAVGAMRLPSIAARCVILNVPCSWGSDPVDAFKSICDPVMMLSLSSMVMS